MFIDYAELMAEDEILMSMQDWVDQTNQFLMNNRRKVLLGKASKGTINVDWEIGVKESKLSKKYRIDTKNKARTVNLSKSIFILIKRGAPAYQQQMGKCI